MTIVCLTAEDIDVADSIFELISEDVAPTRRKFDTDTDSYIQTGGWDPFHVMSTLIISGAIAMGTIGAKKAAAWITYKLTENVGEMCISSSFPPLFLEFIRDELNKAFKSSYTTKEYQKILANALRKNYKTVDDFLNNLDEDEHRAIMLGGNKTKTKALGEKKRKLKRRRNTRCSHCGESH